MRRHLRKSSVKEMLEVAAIGVVIMLIYAGYSMYLSLQIRQEATALREQFQLAVMACLPDSVTQTSTLSLVPSEGALQLHCVKSDRNQDDINVSLGVPVDGY